jgi:hypothetical protein
LFGKLKFISLKDARLLDYPGIELLFIGARADILEDLGEAGPEFEGFEIKELKRFDEETVFQELHLSHRDNPIEPLHGEWK